MVITGSWILALILQLREYGKKVVDNSCVYVWSEEFVNSFSLMWHSFVFVSCIILAGLYSRVVHTLWFRQDYHNDIPHNQQGVLKLRKRVTLTVVIISAIFGVSWGTHSILHVLNDIGSYKLSPVAIPISHVMIMFNSAVNPFAYALINQRFRNKIREMFCCSSVRVLPHNELKDKELANGMSLKPNNTAHSNLR
ncbi:hypothetical protein ABFA07_020513 [Porites harrisoni]